MAIQKQSPTLLSDEQVEHYAAIFIALNERYSLTSKHHFIFDGFLDSPDAFEIAIHQYFANQSLFANRPHGAAIHLHIFLSYPTAMVATLNADHAQREMLAVKAERLLPKQIAAVQKINLAEISWFQEQVVLLFERHHRVLLRGGAYVQPNTHYYRCERKKAGGRR